MRYTDEELDTLTRSQLIEVLEKAKQVFTDMGLAYKGGLDTIEEIKSAQAQAAQIAAGSPMVKGIIIGVVASIILWITSHSFINGVVEGVLLTFVILFIDKRVFAKKHRAAAEAFSQSALPPLLEKKGQFEAQYNELATSDDFCNAKLLLPKEYIDIEAVSTFISLLQTRRAATLGEAINVYENQLHRQRIEEMERQKVEAAQVAAVAQHRAAVAQEQAVRDQKKALNEMAREQSMALEDMSRNAERAARSAAKEQTRAASKNSLKMVKCSKCGCAKIRGTACPRCGHEPDPFETLLGFGDKKI